MPKVREATGMALTGLVVTILLLGGVVAGAIVAVGSLTGTGSVTIPSGGQTHGSSGTTTGATGAPAAPSAPTQAAAASERSVLVTAEDTYFTTRGCYTDAAGLVGAGILRQSPAYWSVTTPAGTCPTRYALVARGPGG